MPVPTSHLFDFLEAHAACSIVRYELASTEFSALRRSVRSIVLAFRDSDSAEAQDITQSLRAVMSEWLTVPMPFDGSMVEVLQSMGEGVAVERRWGRDILLVHEDAIRCARLIQKTDNPLRTTAAERIHELTAAGRSFRIYCHSQARDHFESLSAAAGVQLRSEVFLHSVSQYRNAEPFDVLIKVGPLRARGWGSAPDALLTAPRFDTLLQLVWTGCADEAGFGYDPASSLLPGTDPSSRSTNAGEASSPALRIGWATTQIRSTIMPVVGTQLIADADEFEIFARLTPGDDLRRATLVQIGAGHGILYPPYARVLSFDPAAASGFSVDYRLPGESLAEGMFLAIPILDDAALEGLKAEEGHFSRIWKARLASEFAADAAGLTRRLSERGLNLQNLRSRIEYWCRPATTVIHAPQLMRHFELLIDVLGIDFDSAATNGARRAPWWKYAWDEIRKARGEAIHSGFQEQQLEDERIAALLREMEPQLRSNAAARNSFEQEIPIGSSLQGAVRFYRIAVVEDGFLAPSGELRTIHELSTINQWRS